jgi:short-subunit dehydrogenase
VNNAGYGDFAPFEQLSSERFKAVVDTNFYGVVNVTRAALPIMRKQKSGCILQSQGRKAPCNRTSVERRSTRKEREP